MVDGQRLHRHFHSPSPPVVVAVAVAVAVAAAVVTVGAAAADVASHEGARDGVECRYRHRPEHAGGAGSLRSGEKADEGSWKIIG